MSLFKEPILNIIVVGFHHKKGCQVEFTYPELVPGNPHELPAAWRHLPALALPDGSHNFLSDTIYFHLPGLTEPPHTVYAISCFRQIPIEQVAQRTSDMTRSSVQKSVCVICRVPLFGHFAVKVELVVRAWFRRADFSKIELLEEAYKHLNSCPVVIDQTFEGLSAKNLIEQWRQKAVLLFKLLLLQRKVLLHGSPAGPLTATLLTLLSLLPECVQTGLGQSANIMLTRSLSPPPSMVNNLKKEDPNESDSQPFNTCHSNSTNGYVSRTHEKKPTYTLDNDEKTSRQSFDETLLDDIDRSEVVTGRVKCHSVGEKSKYKVNEPPTTPAIVRDMSVDGLNNLVGQINITECCFPLDLFTEGHLCLPYLSLQYLDLLSDPAVEGFVVGASNELFKQKRQLFDVLVETNEVQIETSDLMLRRQLQLTTEDLRFADHLMRYGATQGDAWIRDQFTSYLVYLLRASLLPDGSREIDPYNALYMSAFKETDAYSKWLARTDNGNIASFTSLVAGHPFAGQLSVADMKLRLAHTMSSTEGGRKVTQAVVSTGRAVATTGRAVGGALSQAKGALSVWWSTLTTASPYTEQPPDGQADTDHEVEEAEPESTTSVNNGNDRSLDTSLSNHLIDDISHIVIDDAIEEKTFSEAEDALEHLPPSTAQTESHGCRNISDSGDASDSRVNDHDDMNKPKQIGKIQVV